MPVITRGLAVLFSPGLCAGRGDDPPLAYLNFDQRLNYSDLVCSATIMDTWRTGGTLAIDSSVTAENLARADVESVFKGKLTSATIIFRWYSWPAGPGGYVFAGPPLADLRSEGRYLLFLRSDGTTGWRVTVPMYQLEIPFAASAPANLRLGLDASGLTIAQRNRELAEEFTAAVESQVDSAHVYDYFSWIAELLWKGATPLIQPFLESATPLLRYFAADRCQCSLGSGKIARNASSARSGESVIQGNTDWSLQPAGAGLGKDFQMRKLSKVLVWAVVLIAVVLAMGITFTIGWRPFIGPRARPLTARKFERTPARLARGEYLVNSVTDCMSCHAEHDWTAHDAPILPGTLGSGQDMNILKGFPGQVFAPNITPDPETGVGSWSDDQLSRALREGVGHDGQALFPFMPYPDLRALSDEDVTSIIVYLRSLPPVRKQRPLTQLIFPVNYLIRSVPQPLNMPVPEPDLSTPEKRGAYLVRLAGCTDCHTPQNGHGQPLPGMDFAGGFIFDGPWGRVASANITPDASGISYYDTTLFSQAIRTGFVNARRLSQIMPWHTYRGMTDEDLAAAFAYLRTLKPVRHRIDNTEPPTYCKVCRQTHGGGNQN